MGKAPDVNEIMTRPYARVVTPDEGGQWNAEVLELPGCFTDGSTREEALENLDEVMRLWFEVKLEDGGHIPQPWEAGAYNGRILLRVPKWVHKEVSKRARADDVSINQWLLAAVSEKLGADGPAARLGTPSGERLSSLGTEFVDVVTAYMETLSAALDPEASFADAIDIVREARAKYAPGAQPKKRAKLLD